MKSKNKLVLSAFAMVLLLLAVSVYGQVHKYYTPGSVWGVTMIRIHPGMDPKYLEYLDTQLKKDSDISIKGGFMKSYKILRSQDDGADWNMLIMREYESYGSLEKNEEKGETQDLQRTSSRSRSRCERRFSSYFSCVTIRRGGTPKVFLLVPPLPAP